MHYSANNIGTIKSWLKREKCVAFIKNLAGKHSREETKF